MKVVVDINGGENVDDFSRTITTRVMHELVQKGHQMPPAGVDISFRCVAPEKMSDRQVIKVYHTKVDKDDYPKLRYLLAVVAAIRNIGRVSILCPCDMITD